MVLALGPVPGDGDQICTSWPRCHGARGSRCSEDGPEGGFLGLPEG